MSLEGSWSFEVTHKGSVYKCRVNDDRIEIAAPSGLCVDAKWTRDGFEKVSSSGGDDPNEEIPSDVLCQADGYMWSQNEAEDP